MSLQFLQPYFGLGNGLQTKNVAGGGAGVGGWVELGRTTLGSPTPTITVSSLLNKRYYMFLVDGVDVGAQLGTFIRMNGDSGTSYSGRRSQDGTADGTDVNQAQIYETDAWGPHPQFSVGYISNISTREKLLSAHIVKRMTAGAGTAPSRSETIGKWINTTNSISSIGFTNWTSGTNYNTGSEVVVLGWDPADTHSNNFWTELATNTLTSSASSIPMGTITAKKYLWIQLYAKNTGGYVNPKLQFNSDTGSNYAVRFSDNGGADSTSTSQTAVDLRMGEIDKPSFSNTFIVNTSSKEKLIISHNVNQNTAGAGTAPARGEVVGKWSNTSTQITNIDIIKTAGGSFDSGSTCTVWGAD